MIGAADGFNDSDESEISPEQTSKSDKKYFLQLAMYLSTPGANHLA